MRGVDGESRWILLRRRWRRWRMDRSAAGWWSCCCVEGKRGVALYNYNVAEEFGGGRAVGGVVWIMQEVAGGISDR